MYRHPIPIFKRFIVMPCYLLFLAWRRTNAFPASWTKSTSLVPYSQGKRKLLDKDVCFLGLGASLVLAIGKK